MRKKRILSISYDEILLTTRQQILTTSGYEVVSALGFAEAKQLCKQGEYDLAIMGHSIPEEDKLEMLKDIAEHCRVPVLALLRVNERPLSGATASVHSHEPKAVLAAVAKLLGGSSKDVR